MDARDEEETVHARVRRRSFLSARSPLCFSHKQCTATRNYALIPLPARLHRPHVLRLGFALVDLPAIRDALKFALPTRPHDGIGDWVIVLSLSAAASSLPRIAVSDARAQYPAGPARTSGVTKSGFWVYSASARSIWCSTRASQIIRSAYAPCLPLALRRRQPCLRPARVPSSLRPCTTQLRYPRICIPYCTTTCADVHHHACHQNHNSSERDASAVVPKPQTCTVEPEQSRENTSQSQAQKGKEDAMRASGCQGKAATESGTERSVGDATATDRASAVSHGGSSVNRASSALVRAKARE
jgi:hypothetical protein